LAAAIIAGFPVIARAKPLEKPSRVPQREQIAARDLLSPKQWDRLDHAVDRGLNLLSRAQQPDGSLARGRTGTGRKV
jgi:hypothetical protein